MAEHLLLDLDVAGEHCRGQATGPPELQMITSATRNALALLQPRREFGPVASHVDAEPFRALFTLTGRAGTHLVPGNPGAGHRSLVRGIPELGVAAQIAQQYHV